MTESDQKRLKSFVEGVYLDAAGVLRPKTQKIYDFERGRRTADNVVESNNADPAAKHTS